MSLYYRCPRHGVVDQLGRPVPEGAPLDGPLMGGEYRPCGCSATGEPPPRTVDEAVRERAQRRSGTADAWMR